MTFEMPPPLFRRHDPETSRDAARNVMGDAAVAALVLAVMQDGVIRNDDEIAAAVLERYPDAPTPGRIRHGRKHLSDLGMIRQCGRTRMTSGAFGRAWVIVREK